MLSTSPAPPVAIVSCSSRSVRRVVVNVHLKPKDGHVSKYRRIDERVRAACERGFIRYAHDKRR